MDNLIRFNSFVFNNENGELVHTDESGKTTVSRLQPQPAKLLKLLLDNHPNVVTREQIQGAIWPDVQVDFDGSMHFCIRQIRAALEDQATNPKYIETIPRRGYRWIAEINDNEKIVRKNFEKPAAFQTEIANDFSTDESSLISKFRSKRFWLFAALGISTIAVLFFLFFLKNDTTNDLSKTSNKIRIAIMPFQPSDENNPFTGNDIAIQLVEILTNKYKDQFDIIGPTTTATIDPQKIIDFTHNYQIDYLINGRFLNRQKGNRMLGELIRTTDGAHVWVQSFAASEERDHILLEIKNGIIAYLNEK